MSRLLAIASLGSAVALWLGLSCSALAAPTQSLDSVRAAAEQALREHYAQPGSRIEVTTEPLDLRLQLAACGQPLRALVSGQAQPRSRMTVPVQCPQPGSWTVRVPVRLQLVRTVLVTSRALLRSAGFGAAYAHAAQQGTAGHQHGPEQLQ